MSQRFLKDVADQMQSIGLVCECPHADGGLYRCGIKGKERGTDGAYIIHLDPPASAWGQNWQTGEKFKYCEKSDKEMSKEERKVYQQRIEVDKVARQKDQKQRWQEAAQTAKTRWDVASPAQNDHPYLIEKQVSAFGLRVDNKSALLVPLYRCADNAFISLQSISAAPEEYGKFLKRFLPGGQTKDAFFPIPANDGSKDSPLLIAEGYATGASLHMATGYAVLVAFSCYNLEAVARMARGRYPEREIVLCADNDCATKKQDGTPYNSGVIASTEAAQAVGARLAICPAHEGKATDFNDLHCWRSLDAVRTVIVEALQQSTQERQDKLPSGFSFREKGSLPGWWYTEVKEKSDPIEIYLCGPLAILGQTRDKDSNEWGLLLQWSDDDNVAHTWAMPRSVLGGRDKSSILSRLMGEGLRVAANEKARQLLYRLLTEYETVRRALCVTRTGWHNDVFVFPDTMYAKQAGTAGIAGITYSPKGFSVPSSENVTGNSGNSMERIVVQTRSPVNPFRVGGTLQGWQGSIGEWSRGNSRIMLAVCASFAAALLEPLGMESGGINFTGGSGIGKTSALIAASSVWGDGKYPGGYTCNWRSTSNGLEELAVLHCDAALCLDEIGQAPSKTIVDASYVLANGMGTARSHQGLALRATRSWRCMVLSTGEKGLRDKIIEEGGKVDAGQLVRLVDVPADAGAGMGLFENLHGYAQPENFSEALKEAAARHYGYPARAFIEKFQEYREVAQKDLHYFMANGLPSICNEYTAEQVKRVAKRFLLCAAAGEMAVKWGLAPWENGEAIHAAKACFNAWIELRAWDGNAEDQAILSTVLLFLEKHGASRFQDIATPNDKCINRVGFRKTEIDGTVKYYVLPESFEHEICKGYDIKKAKQVLVQHGLLVRADKDHITHRLSKSFPKWGNKRCYMLVIPQGEQYVPE